MVFKINQRISWYIKINDVLVKIIKWNWLYLNKTSPVISKGDINAPVISNESIILKLSQQNSFSTHTVHFNLLIEKMGKVEFSEKRESKKTKTKTNDNRLKAKRTRRTLRTIRTTWEQ